MMYIFSFFNPILFFLFFNAILVSITKKEFGKCLPLSFMLSTFIIFVSQALFNTFSIGFYLLIALIIGFIPIFIISSIKNKDWLKEFKNNYFDRGFIAFLVIYIIIYIYNFKKFFTAWDEFSHWGVMVKEMLRTDKLYSVAESTLMVHKDYPPIFQIFELFWTKLCGGYYEPNLIKCMHIFELSLFIPALYRADFKNNKKLFTIITTVLLVLTVFLTILTFDHHGVINTIYTDYFMAILPAYIIFTIISEKDKLSYFSIFNIGISLTFLVMLKQMGLPFYLIVLFVFFVDFLFYIFKNKVKINKKKIYKILFAIIMLIILPLVEWKCWNIYVNELELYQQFNLSDIKILDLPNIINGQSGEEYQSISGINFLTAIFRKNITSTTLSVPFIIACVTCIVLFLIFFYLNKEKFKNNEEISILSGFFIGTLGYIFIMLNMYVFSFGSREGPLLASYDRYMGTYIIFMASLLIMLYYNNVKIKKYWLKLSIIILLLLLPQSPEHLKDLTPSIIDLPKKYYEITAEKITSIVDEKSKVFILGVDDDLARQFYVKYYANPITTNLQYYQFDTNDTVNPYEYISNISAYILDFEYLYIDTMNKSFIDKYSFLFKNGTIIPKRVYRINNINGNIEFELIT